MRYNSCITLLLNDSSHVRCFLLVFPEGRGTRRSNSWLPEGCGPLHFWAATQVPRGVSQGGGAEAGPVVRLLSLPPPKPGFPCRVKDKLSHMLLWFWSSSSHRLCSGFYFNDFYWHTAWEGNPIPLGVLTSCHLHGNNTTGLFLLVLSLMMLLFVLAHTSFSSTQSIHQAF